MEKGIDTGWGGGKLKGGQSADGERERETIDR
jgi:hypothetical protein